MPRPRNHHLPSRVGSTRSSGLPPAEHDEDEDDLSVLSLFKAEQTAKEVSKTDDQMHTYLVI